MSLSMSLPMSLSHLNLKVKEKIDFLRFVKHSFNSNKTGGQILLSRTRSHLFPHIHFYIYNSYNHFHLNVAPAKPPNTSLSLLF